MNVTIKSPEDIQQMRTACRLASEVLDYISPFVQIGTSTEELDRLCYRYMLEQQNTVPAPLNYAPNGYPPYPKAICASVNDVVCHGIPNERLLRSGDILNLDITVITPAGYFGDTSRMFCLGETSVLAQRLCKVTYEAMWLGIRQVAPGQYLGDIGAAIQQYAEGAGYSVVREYCGHGIGKVFHEAPQVLHYGKPKTGLRLEEGMIFTIEPMINAGQKEVRTMPDYWTVRTRDRSLSAQWEHTILVTSTGYEVLTISAGSPPRPAVGA